MTGTAVERVDEEEASAPRSGSLKPVLDALPKSVYDNPTWKGMSYFIRDLVLYLVLVTALIFVPNVAGALALDVVAMLCVVALFIVGHDSAHGALFKTKRMNSVVGHIAMLPSLHVYEGWILGHNRIHHSYTVRQGFDFVWHPATPEEFRQMSGARRLLHRFEWSWAGAGLYYMHQVWWTKMIVGKPPHRWARLVRRDRFFVLGFLVLSTGLLSWAGVEMTGTAAGTVWLIVRVLVLPFLGFQYMIGSFVHVHHVQPEIRWWKRSEWTKFKGQILFLPFVFLLTGRWSPRRARQDAEAHDKDVQREMQELAPV